MFLVAHRATDRGAEHALARMLEMERQTRIAAQHAAWLAETAFAEERAKRIKEAEGRSRAMAAELRAQGIRFRPTYASLEARACRVFHVKPSQIRSNRRHREIVFARQFVMYWAVRLTKLSLPQIGRLMGGRDHTTVLHGKSIYPEKRAKMGRNLRSAR
jgi:chromosomal replication initiation ATPase DnaA